MLTLLTFQCIPLNRQLLWHIRILNIAYWGTSHFTRRRRKKNGTHTDQPKKINSFFAFTPRTKILKRELSRRKHRETSRKLTQSIFVSARFRGETPRNLAAKLRELSRRYSAKSHCHFKILTIYFFVLFDLWFYVPVDKYGHVETVS